jgi:hypothetical protein
LGSPRHLSAPTTSAPPTDPLDTEHLFGFVEGADIGGKGEKEFVIDSALRAGRGTGSFAAAASGLEFKYTAFQNLRISGAATLAYYDVAGVTGIEDARRAAIQSLSFDARFRVLDRTQAPFGLTLSMSPHWGLVDETSGVRTDHFGTEIQLLADRELKPDQLVGGVNLLFANDRARLLASDGIEHESNLGAGAALAAQIMPGVWLGAEARLSARLQRCGTERLLRSRALHWSDPSCAVRRERLHIGRVGLAGLGPNNCRTGTARPDELRTPPSQNAIGVRILSANLGRAFRQPGLTYLPAQRMIRKWMRCIAIDRSLL